MGHLDEEERLLVDTIRAFIDRDVGDVEHANGYSERWIEQMKELGVYGLAVAEEYGGTPAFDALVTRGSPRSIRGRSSARTDVAESAHGAFAYRSSRPPVGSFA